MSVSGRLSDGLIRWTSKYDNISFRIKTPFLLSFLLLVLLLLLLLLLIIIIADINMNDTVKRMFTTSGRIGICHCFYHHNCY